MYYLLLLVIFVILYYVFVKILSSVVKGCLTALLIALLIWIATLLYRSTYEVVPLLGGYKITNLVITKNL
jgi:hypothetical protein